MLKCPNEFRSDLSWPCPTQAPAEEALAKRQWHPALAKRQWHPAHYYHALNPLDPPYDHERPFCERDGYRGICRGGVL